MNRVKILLVDDHALFREGMVHVLAALGDDVEVLQADGAKRALELLGARDDLDLLLVDLALPDARPFEVLEAARRLQPQVPVVVVSATEDRFEIDRAESLGAQGYVFKSSPGHALLAALRRVIAGELVFPERTRATSHAGPVELTDRQRDVLRMLARGQSNKEIAGTLGVAENTVKVHLAALYKTLGVTRRTGALLKAQSLGLIRDDP